MEYCAEYSIIIEGCVWGVEHICFDADSDDEAIDTALELGEEHSSKKQEYFLEFVYDEEGNELDLSRIYDKKD